jgi:hypothetical protein
VRIKQIGWYVVCPHTFAIAACPSGRRAGWAVRRFDSLVLSEVPGVVLYLCAQVEGTFHHNARYEALLAPRIGAQPLLANRSFTTWGPATIVIGSTKRVAGSGSVSL